MKVINLVRERKSENWSRADSFLVEDFVVNPEEAMREAIREYMKSEKGKKSIEYACGDFNWGDAMMYVTDEFLKSHGLSRFHEDVETIFVNQDELLFPEIQEKILNVDEDEEVELEDVEYELNCVLDYKDVEIYNLYKDNDPKNSYHEYQFTLDINDFEGFDIRELSTYDEELSVEDNLKLAIDSDLI